MVELDKNSINKILCIKLKGIGDVVLSTVVLDNLRDAFPKAEIDFLTEPPSKAVLEHLPHIHKILLFKPKEKFGGIKTILRVFIHRYDLILDFYSNPRTAMITFLSNAKYRAGFPYRGRTYAYNLLGPSERNAFHAAQLHLEFLKKIGIQTKSANLHFGLAEKDTSFAKKFIEETFTKNDFVIVLSPSGGWASKKCDADKFAEFADELYRIYGAKFLIPWGPEDYNDAVTIKKMMNVEAVLAPKTSIAEGAALMAKAKLVLANDSGPMHIAAAVGTPTLSLHGPTDPALQGPFGDKHAWLKMSELDCIGCNLLICPRKHECFLSMPKEMVVEKVGELILKNKIQIK